MKVTVNRNNNLSASLNKTESVLVNQSSTSGATTSLFQLTDVDISTVTDGSVLVYDGNVEKFVSTLDLEKQNINGGHF